MTTLPEARQEAVLRVGTEEVDRELVRLWGWPWTDLGDEEPRTRPEMDGMQRWLDLNA